MKGSVRKKYALIFPGQGSQGVSMGRDFYDTFKAAKETFQQADDILQMHLSKLCFEGPADELTLTKNSQLAIFVTSMAIWRTIQEQFPSVEPFAAAGLSLGEYTALAASGRISFEECLLLVRARGQLMQDACEVKVGTMGAVLGLSPEVIEEVCSSLRPKELIWVANINCPGQVVISGTPAGYQAACRLLTEKGAKKIIPLVVSGAFHSGLMSSAAMGLETYVTGAGIRETHVHFPMNVPGKCVTAIKDIRKNLIEQVTGTVRWEECVRSIDSLWTPAPDQLGVGTFLEIGYGKTLAGMNKKIGVVAPTVSVGTINELEMVAELEK